MHMKIWYQSYTQIGVDPAWKVYEDDLKAYLRKVARPDTSIDVYGVNVLVPKLFESDYIQHLHVAQIVDAALQAEREGYDAFCLGGTLDLGYSCIKEVLDIPAVFIGESSFLTACMVSRSFAIVGQGEKSLRRKMQLVREYGLDQRCVPGGHMGSNNLEIIGWIANDPQRLIDMFSQAVRQAIANGAGSLIPGFGAIGSFLGQREIHAIDGVPIIDIVAVTVKNAEMLVDLRKLGLSPGRAAFGNNTSKEELLDARRKYGVAPG